MYSGASNLLKNGFPAHKIYFYIAVLLLLLPGCGVKSVYNNLDLIIPWYVDDLITLNDKQQAELEKRLAEVLTWHRSTQLKQYSAFMRETGDHVKNGLTEEELDEAFAEADQLWQLLIGKVAPELVKILITASDEQKRELFENIEKQNDKFKKTYLALTEEQRRKDRVKRIQKTFRQWLGSLDERQITTVEHYVSNFVPIHNDRWLFRLRWQNELRTLLNANPAQPRVQEGLQKLFVNMQDMYSQEYRNKRRINIKLIKEMILQVSDSITNEQSEYLVNRIESYAGTLEELAARS